MNEPTTLVSSTPGSSEPSPPRTLPRLRFPFLCLLIFWLLSFLVGVLNKPYFVGFMYSMASAALVTLLFVGWWWFNRGLRIWEKCAGFVLIILEAFVVGKFSDQSVNFFTLWMSGLPLVASVVVAWLFFAKRFGLSWVRIGFILFVTLGWSYFMVIRIDGADSRLKMQTHWRWTPTTEEQFLAGARSGSAAARPVSGGTSALLAAAATDWVAFRGPERDGVIIGTIIATNWTANPPALLWKRAVGPAWSSLIVVGPRVFTQEQRGEQEAVVCYDATDGEPVWLHDETARFNEAVSGPGPRATPTFSNGRLYTLGGTGLLSCRDAATGQLVWKRDIKQDSGAKVPMWAFSSSPLAAGDLVVVYAGGDAGKALLAYRSQTGEIAWSASAGQSSYSSAEMATIAGVPQCLMLHDEALSSFDPATGKKLWQAGSAMKGAPRCGQPHLIQGNELLIGMLNGTGCSLLEIATNAGGWSITKKWDSKDLKPEFPDLVVYNGYAYGFDVGVFCCLNLADGKRAWKEGRYGRGQVMLLRDQGLLLISSETGELVLLSPDPAAHRELARFQALEGKTWNHPVVCGDRVFLRNAQEMACYSFSPQHSKLASR